MRQREAEEFTDCLVVGDVVATLGGLITSVSIDEDG